MNVPRLLLGGVASAAVMWLLEVLASQLYLNEMQSALRVHNLALEATVGSWLWSVVIALLIGLTMSFMYVMARTTRLGPGPRTASLVACALWLGGYLPYLIGYHVLGLYTPRLLVQWAIVALAEMTAGSIAGARIYREAASVSS